MAPLQMKGITCLYLIHLMLTVYAQNDCAYFVYKSTPIPLNQCMRTNYSDSVIYRCTDDMITYTKYNNAECMGDILKKTYFNSSEIFISNCADTLPTSSACNLSTVMIWNNPYCFGSSFYELSFVVDTCVATDTHSIYYGCDAEGKMTTTTYPNNQQCHGETLTVNGTKHAQSASEVDAIDASCFAMSCHNQSYVSYTPPSKDQNDNGMKRFFDDPRSMEIVFIIAAAMALGLFWGCYCYRNVCCKARDAILDANVSDGDTNVKAVPLIGKNVEVVNESAMSESAEREMSSERWQTSVDGLDRE